MPGHIFFYDCETLAFKIGPTEAKHLLKLGVACYWRRPYYRHLEKEEWLTFREPSEFWDFVESKARAKTKILVIAHNQHFDFAVVDGFRELASRGWSIQRPALGSDIFIVSFTKNGAKIQVLDSTNWFKFSIRTLGDRLGLPKLTINFGDCSEDELETYCTRDVQILKRTFLEWCDFLEEQDLGNFRPTISSQAMQAYRHRFMPYQIFIHAHPDAISLERASYRGGRAECFFIGDIKTKLYHLDFNSLYPSVMKTHLYPHKLVFVQRHPTRERLERALQRYLVIAKLRIKIEEPGIAYRANRLVFPIGEFEATLTTPEILWVKDHGSILKVGQYSQYEGAPLFRTYVQELFQLRRQFQIHEDRVGDLMTKLMLNSLPGKFGQKQNRMVKLGQADPSQVEVSKAYWVEKKQFFDQVTFGGASYMVDRTDKEARHSFPGISAFVTAYARMKLWRTIKKAGRSNVFYCDTDSIFTNQEGFDKLEKLIHPTDLGRLKVKGVADKMTIFDVQDYEFGSKQTIRGVKADAVELKPGFFRQARFLRFRSLARRKSLDAPIVQQWTKQLRRRYRKGTVNPDGTVTPFVLPVTPPHPLFCP